MDSTNNRSNVKATERMKRWTEAMQDETKGKKGIIK
jgi:hypothetical protein